MYLQMCTSIMLIITILTALRYNTVRTTIMFYTFARHSGSYRLRRMVSDEETHQRIAPLLPWEDQELPCVTIGNVNETKSGRLYHEPLLTLSVPNILLCKWHYENQPKLISVLNASIIQHTIAIHENC